MTHTHSIINLACIIRKHESGNVTKVLLAAAVLPLAPHPLRFSGPLLVVYRQSARLRGGTAPRVSSLCPIRLLNEELRKAGSE